MSDRPIIFSAPMVRAMLEGRKTQTRRVLKPQPPEQPSPNCHWAHKPVHPAPYLDAYCGEPRTPQNPRGMSRDWHWWQVDNRPGPVACRVPYAPGDRLYVRESIARQETDQGIGYQTFAADGRQVWPLTEWYRKRPSIPSIHMPRWASRLTLTVTDVRVQRLQDISEDDAVAEGCLSQVNTHCGPLINCYGPECPVDPVRSCNSHGCWGIREDFSILWNSIHGPAAWDANPWCVAVSFTVQHGNIDQLGGRNE